MTRENCGSRKKCQQTSDYCKSCKDWERDYNICFGCHKRKIKKGDKVLCGICRKQDELEKRYENRLVEISGCNQCPHVSSKGILGPHFCVKTKSETMIGGWCWQKSLPEDCPLPKAKLILCKTTTQGD